MALGACDSVEMRLLKHPIPGCLFFFFRIVRKHCYTEHRHAASLARIDLPLLDATARAYRWSNDLLAGRARSIAEIARREHLTARHVRRVMRLAFLAPKIVKAIAEGRQPADLSAIAMTQRIELPPLWSAQQQALEPR